MKRYIVFLSVLLSCIVIAAPNPNGDSDGDSVSDYDEYVADTSPSDSNDYFRVTAFSNGPPARVFFKSSTNRFYTLEWCGSLPTASWTNVPDRYRIRGIHGPDVMTDTNPPTGICFYRMLVSIAGPPVNELTDDNESTSIGEDDDISSGAGFNVLSNTTNPDGPSPASVNSVDSITIMINSSDQTSDFTIPTLSTPGTYTLTHDATGNQADLTLAANGAVTLINDERPLFDLLDFNDSASLQIGYTVTDGEDTDSSTASIEVTGSNDLSDGNEETYIGPDQDITGFFNLLDNAYNPDGPSTASVNSIDSISFEVKGQDASPNFLINPTPPSAPGTYTLTHIPSGGTADLTIGANGDLTLANGPTPLFGFVDGYAASLNIEYTVTDGFETDASIVQIIIFEY